MKINFFTLIILAISSISILAQDSLYLQQGTFFTNHAVENKDDDGEILFKRYPYLYTREENNSGNYTYQIYRTDETPFDYAPNWVGDINFSLEDRPNAELYRLVWASDSTIIAMYFRQDGDGPVQDYQNFGRYFYAQTPTQEDPDKGARFEQPEVKVDLNVSASSYLYVADSLIIEKSTADIAIKKIGFIGDEDNFLSNIVEYNADVLETDAPIKGLSFSTLTQENIVSLGDGIIAIGQGSILVTVDISVPSKPEIIEQKDLNFVVSELRASDALYVISRGCCSEPALYLMNNSTLEVRSSIELGASELISVGKGTGDIYAVSLFSTYINAYRYKAVFDSESESDIKLILDAKGTNLTSEYLGFPGKGSLSGSSLTISTTFNRDGNYPTGYTNLSIVSTGSNPTSIDDEVIADVKGFELSQNYPNPFNPTTNIGFEIPQASDVKLQVMDMLGRTVAVLVDNRLSAGSHSVVFDARSLASGIYFYTIDTGSFSQTRKMTILK